MFFDVFRYAFVQMDSSAQVQKALESVDCQDKLGKDVRYANFDEIRDGTLNPWPAKERPEMKGKEQCLLKVVLITAFVTVLKTVFFLHRSE